MGPLAHANGPPAATGDPSLPPEPVATRNEETRFMRLRGRGTSKDQRLEVALPEAAPPAWEAAARFAMASVVVVWITLATGSVEQAALAVSAVAAAAHLTRGVPPTSRE
jgi:hypothetical protein